MTWLKIYSVAPGRILDLEIEPQNTSWAPIECQTNLWGDCSLLFRAGATPKWGSLCNVRRGW